MNIYQERTLWLISIFLILRLIFLYLSPLGLHGDEAQYWVWSKNLDWGYYSKPPFVALIISITTSIFGDIEWAVRVSSPLLHSFIAFLIFRTASFAFDERTGFWAAAIYFLMPAVWVSSAIVSTDAALLLFWALALNAWIHLRLEKSYFWTLVMAFAIGLGLLSKYAMFYFVLALLLATIFDKNSKQVFFSLKGLVLALISSCIILPNLIWNYKNNFVTISHTIDNANMKNGLTLNPAELLTFWVDQLGVFGPISLIILILAIIIFFKFRGVYNNKTINLLLILTIIPLALISLQALFSRANANWAVTSYVSGSIILAHYLTRHGSKLKTWVLSGIVIQSVVCLSGFIILSNVNMMNRAGLTNSVKRLISWPETVSAVENIINQGHMNSTYEFVAIDKRTMFYSLFYYGLNDKLPLKMWTFGKKPLSHAELTHPLQKQDGPILLLNYYNQDESLLKSDFENLVRLSDLDIDLGGGKRRLLRVWAGYGYTPRKGRPYE